ncbi:MAG: GntR family transcriptional regulator [Candidatus Avoscillospira sp.]
MMEKTALRTISTVEAVSNMLEEDIYSLRYTMGEKLTEAELVSRYNVSRNTLRESMTYLTSKGLLERVANKGIYVKEILADDVAEIFHLRELLELEAIRKIVASGSVPKKLYELADEVSYHDPATDSIENLKADIDFHTYLVEAAGSPRLMNMYETLLYEVKLCIFQSQAFCPPRPENIVLHYKLLRAMETGDLIKALSCLREHIASAIETYQKGLLSRDQR